MPFADRIVAIRFEGNEVTDERIMRQEMAIKTGDRADLKAIERSRQAIMDLGLFAWVRADLEPAEGGKVLVITVKERYYILPLPLATARDDGTYNYGMELRLDNLGGLNQRFKLKYEEEDSVDGNDPTRKKASVEFAYPRILGTRLQFSTAAGISRTKVNIQNAEASYKEQYKQENRNFSVNVSRWLNGDGASRGWRAGGGLSLQRKEYVQVMGTPVLPSDSQAASLTWNLDYYDVRQYPYNRDGRAFGYVGTLGSRELGSDYSFNRSLLFHRSYQPTGWSRANINTRVQLGLANGHPFGGNAYSVGGGSTLRGYETSFAEGNAFFLANVEYLHPISGYRQLRLVAFVDAGNAYPEIGDLDLTDLHGAAGIGFRWRVQSFVDVSLAVDIGYGFTTGDTLFYGDTSETF